MKKSRDYIGRYLSDKHYRIEPHKRDTIKCYYCGAIVEKWAEHKGVLICLECYEEVKN